MKLLCFLHILCLFLWVTEASIKTRNPVFVYSLTNIDEQSLQYLANSFNSSKLPILENGYGLRMNITIIPSANPDNYVTIRTIDLPKYSKDYFIDLFKQYNASGDASATFKGLLKATQICSDNSKIVMYSDSKLRDENLLREIVTLWIDKNLEIDSSFKAFSPELADSLEYKIIDQIEKSKNFMKRYSDINNQYQLCKKSGEPSKEDEGEKSITALVYGMINATEDDLKDIAQKMSEYHVKRRKNSDYRVYNSCYQNQVTYGYTSNEGYEADYFLRLVPKLNDTNSCKSTLNVLLEATKRTYYRNQQIVYFTNNEPADSNDVFYKVAEESNRYRIQVIFHTYGELSKKPLPQSYQVIADAYKFTDQNEISR